MNGNWSLLRPLSELKYVITRARLDWAPHRVAGWVRELVDRLHGYTPLLDRATERLQRRSIRADMCVV